MAVDVIQLAVIAGFNFTLDVQNEIFLRPNPAILEHSPLMPLRYQYFYRSLVGVSDPCYSVEAEQGNEHILLRANRNDKISRMARSP